MRGSDSFSGTGKRVRGNDSVASVEECVLRRKRDRDLDRGCLSDRQNLHTYLERKAESAVRGESAAQKRPSEAEADMEVRNWEQKRSEVALCETHRELEDWNYNKRINRLIRLKETKKIEELRRICYEETDRAR